MIYKESSFYTNGDLSLEEYNRYIVQLAAQNEQPSHDWQSQSLLKLTFQLWVRLLDTDKIRVPKAQYQMLYPLTFDIHDFIENHELTKQFKKSYCSNEQLFYYSLFVSESLHQIFTTFATPEIFSASDELKEYIGKEEMFFNDPKFQKLFQARRTFYQQFFHDKQLQAKFDYHIHLAYKQVLYFIRNQQHVSTNNPV